MQLTVNRDSWILTVAAYGGLYVDDRTDLCSVFWHFMWGLVRAPFWIALFGCLGAGVGFLLLVWPAIVVIGRLNLGFWYDEDVLFIASALWSFLAFTVYTLWTEGSGKTNHIVKAAGSTADIICAAYRGWKDKTCVMVAVK